MELWMDVQRTCASVLETVKMDPNAQYKHS